MLGWLFALLFLGAAGFLLFKQYRDFKLAKLEERLTETLDELQKAELATADLAEAIEAQRKGATRLIRIVPSEVIMAVADTFVKLDRLDREHGEALNLILDCTEAANAQSKRKWVFPPTPAEFERLSTQSDRAINAGQKIVSEVESVRQNLLRLADATAGKDVAVQPAPVKAIKQAIA